MRRRIVSLSVFLVALPVAVVALPVVAAPAAAPHPVAAHLYNTSIPIGLTPSFPAALTGQTDLASTAQLSTKPFRALGLSWLPDSRLTALDAKVRVHTGSTWSAWQDLSYSRADTGGDRSGTPTSAPAGVRDGTDPLWVDHADGVQVRVVNVVGDEPQSLRVDLIDPGTSAADASPGSPAAVSNAYADAGQPQIYTRAQWGADESLRLSACPSGPSYTGAAKVGFLHHTVTGNSYNPGDVPAIIRSIYAYHVQGQGWCDVGYNFLVDKFGRIWEGRYGGVDKNVLGAHTGGFNTDSFGVSMIGTYDTVTPPQAQLDGVASLMAWKFALNYDNPAGQTSLTSQSFSGSRYPAGTVVNLNVISGHRDVDMTSCPGNAGYAQLPALRQEVLRDMGSSGFVHPGVASATPRTVSGNGSLRITAGMLTAGSWQLAIQDANGNTVRTLGGSGSSVDVTWDMTDASGSPVPDGQYTLSLTGTQSGNPARPWSMTTTVGGVFGSFDSVTAPSTGTIDVTGWAMHGTDDSPVTLRVTVSSSDAGSFQAVDPRPDVAAKYAGYSPDHGFGQVVSATSGYHTVCVYGVNVIGGPDTLLGCRGVTVPGTAPVLTGPAANPIGHLDFVQGGPASVRVVGWALDPETAGPINVAVYVDNAFAGNFQAALSRSDVAAAHPNYGSSHGFDQAVRGIAPGNHRVCVYALNIGNGTTNPTLGCATANVPTGNPTGHLDVVQATPGGFVMWGWTLDPDTAAPIAVHVTIDGRLVGVLTANQSRGDVAAAFPLYGASHGFAAQLTSAAGTHTVCAYGMNVGGGSGNPSLGCRTVSVFAGNPIGHLDAVVVAPGSVAMWGWAIDPDTRAPTTVAVTVDGHSVTTLKADKSRPDVGGVYPAYGALHGFAQIVAIAGGTHNVCAVAANLLAGSADSTIGCRTVTVLAGNPIGHLDHASAAGGVLTMWGWSIDPDTAAPIDVHVYVDGKFLAVLQADQSRPDVGAAFPVYGAKHGYSFAGSIGTGQHTVCTYGINVAAGNANTPLGCAAVSS